MSKTNTTSMYANPMRPDQIKKHLDKYVIGQDEAKKTRNPKPLTPEYP